MTENKPSQPIKPKRTCFKLLFPL